VVNANWSGSPKPSYAARPFCSWTNQPQPGPAQSTTTVTASGYRDYPAATVALLGFIKRAQPLDFTLNDVEELLHLDRGGPQGCDAARELVQAGRAGMEGRIADLRRMRDC